MKNSIEANEFSLVGLTNGAELQALLFLLFTLIYLIALVRYLGMIMLILLGSCLYTPMYIFLTNLSLVDFCDS